MLFLEGHARQVMSLKFSPDGRWLASAGWDGSVRIWDVHAGKQFRCVRTNNPHATVVAFSPDGDTIVAGFVGVRGGGCVDANLAIFPRVPSDLDAPDYIHGRRGWRIQDGNGIRNVAIFPNGAMFSALCGAANDRDIGFWNLPERTLNYSLRARKAIHQIALRPDGGELAALFQREACISLWQLVPGPKAELIDEVAIGGETGEAITYSPDGQTIVATLGSGKMFWWPPNGPESGMVKRGHGTPARALVFSPDGRTVLTGESDGLVRIWDAATQKQKLTYNWEIGEIGCADFSPDGLTAAAGGYGPIFIWDVDI